MNPKLVEEVNTLHANVCAALADPTRILILYLLHENKQNVTSLVDSLALPQPTVSRHLKVLKERGVVFAQRDGQSVIYELTDTRVIEALDLLRGMLADRLTSQAKLIG